MRRTGSAVTVAILATLVLIVTPVANAQGPTNVLLIVADDVGVDQVRCYQKHFNLDPDYPKPCTPNIDKLATGGVRFTNAWSNPVCSPTRAQMMTGRTAYETGIGGVTNPTLPERVGLDPSLAILPTLTEHDAAVGKWHLAHFDDQWPSHPLDVGFGPVGSRSGFLGTFYNLSAYDNWYRWDGTEPPPDQEEDGQHMTTYATAQTTADAMAYLDEFDNLGAGPWFLYVSYHAAHGPFHCPEEHGADCPVTNCQPNWCHMCEDDPEDPLDAPVEQTRAMVQALDAEIGDLLAATPSNTVVIFIGDNGTPKNASADPFRFDHAKGTVYQGGINVPLIVQAPGGQTGSVHELVCATDILATTADFLGTTLPGDFPESVSLTSYVTDGQPPVGGPRDHVYAEMFEPTYTPVNGAPPVDYVAESHIRAVRDDRFKLIEERLGGSITQKFYSLCSENALAGGVPTPHDPAILDFDGDPLASAFEGVDLLQTPVGLWPDGACNALYQLRRKLLYDYPGLPIERTVELRPTVVRTAEHVGASTPTECSERIVRVSFLPNPPVNLIERTFLEFDVSTIPDGVTISKLELDVDVIRVASGAYTSVAAWPLQNDVSEYDAPGSGLDCDDLFSGLTGSAYATEGSWAPNCRYTKTFTLNSAGRRDLRDQINGDDLFSVALRFQHEDPLFADAIDLADVYGLHRLRVHYRSFGGGGSASPRQTAAPAPVTGLEPARPSPFNPTTTISYSIGRPTHVSLNVYSVGGQLMRKLVDATQAPSNYSVVWDGRDGGGRTVPSGIYFYRLEAGDFSETRKMVLLK